MPGKDALDVLKEIKITFPLLPVVIFSMNSDEVYAFRMLKNGASAYINKETKPSHIIEILRIVLRGKKYISPHQAEIFAQDAVSFAKENTVTHELLTDREFQIFCLLANGISKTEIAEKLDISIHTLSNHRNNIMKKMKLTTNAELIRYAIQTRIIE
jgi:DNA-binding NarL/FixJ family response regulator